MRVYQHLSASNDTNGNPRRLFRVYDVTPEGADTVKVYDEGYRGTPAECRGMHQLPGARIDGPEYRAILRDAAQRGILVR